MAQVKFFFLIAIFIAGMFISCGETDRGGQKIVEGRSRPLAGPHTIKIDKTQYTGIFYVSAAGGSDQQGDGTSDKPYKSLSHALDKISGAGREKRFAVYVSAGEYDNGTLQMKEFVDLYGGFSTDWQERDIWNHQSLLSGEGKRRVLVGSNHARLDGFSIQRGVVRGKGGALFCDGVSPVITNNIFVQNKTLKPLPWKPKFWHETANDGGAIHCVNKSAAVITYNLFVRNTTESGRGAAIACQDQCKPVIAENVFINNTAGLDDPMRSSDGGAVSLFDWCDVRVENNIFIGNRALASNDAGGVFVALWSSAQINGNLFLNNEATDDAGGLFVGGQEHRYDSPLDPIPPADKFFVSITGNTFIGNLNKSMNSGAMRFTMESRGEFKRNYTAFNNGIYFQRSEVLVADNLILDDFLFKETKEGLKISEISGNMIWADFDLQTEAKVANNIIKGKDTVNLKIKSAGMELKAASVIYQRRKFITTVIVPGLDLKTDELANRVFRSGKRWGVIRSNDAATITLWGNFASETDFSVWPLYQLP